MAGQRSFAFGRDGDLIEIKPQMRRQSSSIDSDDVFTYSEESKGFPSHPGPSTAIHCLGCKTPKKSNLTKKKTKENKVTSDIEVHVKPVNLNLKFNNNNISDSNISQYEKRDENCNQEESSKCPRRASESFSKSSFPGQEELCRRHSDALSGEVKETFDSTSRRKSILKRQSNVETDIAESFSKLDTNTDLLLNEYEDDNCEECEVTCCHKKKIRSDSGTEIEKVLSQNKKLEDIVVQNQIETPDFKDMLSSVLSVRMEPGF